MFSFLVIILLGIFLTTKHNSKKNQYVINETQNHNLPSAKDTLISKLPHAEHLESYEKAVVDPATHSAHVYFKQLIQNNRASRDLFSKYMDYFGGGDKAFPAAQFMALSPIWENSPDFNRLMTENLKTISLQSEYYIKKIESNPNGYNQDPFTHQSMLNLVHQLSVSPEKKISIYARSMSQPLEFDHKGNLKENSLAFETALILMKQEKLNEEVVIKALRPIVVGLKNPQEKAAVKSRISTYFPDFYQTL